MDLYGHWLQKSGAETYAYDVRLARSTDDGKTFSQSFTRTTTERRPSMVLPPCSRCRARAWPGVARRPRDESGGHDGHGDPSGDMSVRAAIYDRAGKQSAGSADRSARLRVLSYGGGGDGRRADRGVSRSQRRRNPRHLSVPATWRQVDRAGAGSQRRVEDCRVPGERPGVECGGPERGDRVVHGKG